MLSEPDLVVSPGRPASLFVGGELAYRAKDIQGRYVTGVKEYGTRVDLIANLVSSESIHLDLRFRVSEPEDANAGHVISETVPVVSRTGIETATDVRPGQTVVLCGSYVTTTQAVASPPAAVSGKPAGNRDRTDVCTVVEELETLVLVKAEIVKKGTTDVAKAKPAVWR